MLPIVAKSHYHKSIKMPKSKILTEEQRIDLQQMEHQAVGKAVVYEDLVKEFEKKAGEAFVAGKREMTEEGAG